ncbi:RES family NAD+ phosphorylase [Caldimonas brevitalea]|uniref:RES domain-containing protein n=1 Tax=Caldimonas brevitalea TaxID=413882 RepID=A0A0G3BST0_9BURK|nr:RES family NAD+ phosphorylase [Caldimonas brevitalea]AKJ31063.1 hypothetical protein AAW51_4372 [Caldimonas brevitalea]
MLRKPKKGSFESRLQVVPVSTQDLWRFSKFPDTEPYWATRGHYRFDDPGGAVGAATFGVLYVGHLPEVAFAESCIHENSLFNTDTGRFEVPKAVLTGRSLVNFRHPAKPQLLMADLTGPALKALGLNNDISAGNDYGIPQQWSAAIHTARPDVDGIRYASRQLNSSFCYAVFQRSGLARDQYRPLPPDLLEALCARFNVAPV